jgi:hypothetical protein
MLPVVSYLRASQPKSCTHNTSPLPHARHMSRPSHPP